MTEAMELRGVPVVTVVETLWALPLLLLSVSVEACRWKQTEACD